MLPILARLISSTNSLTSLTAIPNPSWLLEGTSIWSCPPLKTDKLCSRILPQGKSHPKLLHFINVLDPDNSLTHGGLNTPLLTNSHSTLVAHKMYSRLEHFFISAPLIPYVTESDISPITWSDHAPIMLDLTLSQTYTSSCHWSMTTFYNVRFHAINWQQA